MQHDRVKSVRNRGEKEAWATEWSDGNTFTLCLALKCREGDPSQCLPALIGSSWPIPKFPLRCCGRTPISAHTYKCLRHHVHRHARVCAHTAEWKLAEHRPSRQGIRGINRQTGICLCCFILQTNANMRNFWVHHELHQNLLSCSHEFQSRDAWTVKMLQDIKN